MEELGKAVGECLQERRCSRIFGTAQGGNGMIAFALVSGIDSCI